MNDYLKMDYALQRTKELALVDRPERRLAHEARLARRPRRRWRSR
jgi:hypothetical protein